MFRIPSLLIAGFLGLGANASLASIDFGVACDRPGATAVTNLTNYGSLMIGRGNSGWETGSGDKSHFVVIACAWSKEIELERGTPSVDLVVRMINSDLAYSLDEVIHEIHQAGYKTQVNELRNALCFCSEATRETADLPIEPWAGEEN
ncbi:MAG: hypothetical protein FalmKO_15750 [Falsiruegeria mediterranea]